MAKRKSANTDSSSSKKRSATITERRLDPLLSFAALRAKKESIALLPRAISTAPRNLRITKDFPVGIMSVASQLSPSARESFTATDQVQVLVECDRPDDVRAFVDGLNGTAEKVGPRSLVARVPRSALSKFESLAHVRSVEASVQLRPACDMAHRSTGLLPAQGLQRQTTLTGNGVLIGIVDTGIDVSHPAFQSAGQSRIVAYLDQASGQSLNQQQITGGQGFPDTIGHGTHVAGIAAGNGAGSPQNRHAGVATKADIAMVKTTFQSADIASGVKFLFDLAEQRGQPCVVNLSLGGHYGGHDGSTVTERTIDQLSGPGRLVVVSAGNEGRDRIHAGTTMPVGSSTPARWSADFQITKRIVDGQVVGLLILQVWHQHEDDLLIQVRTPNGELFSPTLNSTSELERDAFVIQADHRVAAYSGDHHTTFQIVTVPQSQWLNGWSLIVDEDRSAGHHGAQVGPVHAWVLNQEMGTFLTGSTQSHLVGMPGTAFSAITVASYATRREWTSIDPANPNVLLNAVNLEDISYFSSPGPTRDGDNKPEIAAPGQWLLAPLSKDAILEEVPNWLRIDGAPYAALQGTSMAAPYVAGTLALLLEKEPRIDWAEVKRRVIKSARQDGFSKPCWNPRWGYGKLDALKLLTIEPKAD